MQTLDEVIAKLEDEGLFADALHYLKEYRDTRQQLLDGMKRLENKELMYIHAMANLEDNPPLTFEEVREMLDKPVWMEWNNVKGWRLVNCFDSVTTGKKAVALTDRFGVDFVFDEEMFEKCEVKVYRKEHHEDA